MALARARMVRNVEIFSRKRAHIMGIERALQVAAQLPIGAE